MSKSSITTRKQLNAAITNALWSRADMVSAVNGNRVGQEGRDIDETCGYPETLTAYDYQTLYDRFGVAARVVSCFPDECWRRPPAVYESANEKVVTPWEKAWAALFQNPDTNPNTYLHRADVLSGVGSFGVLLLGIEDGQDLDKPVRVDSAKANRLIYMRAFAESDVTVMECYTDPRKANYGKPKFYEIDLAHPDQSATDENQTAAQPLEIQDPSEPPVSTKTKVHASRVLHVADNRYSSELFGIPRMQQVYDHLLDLKKVSGGSAEMFWQNAAPGYAVETQPNVLTPAMDTESIREAIKRWRNDQERFIALENMTIRSLQPQVADPTPTAAHLLQMICASIGFPLRAFLGSELGQMASETDRVNLNDRLARRQNNYLTPLLIRPFIQKLTDAGVLPPAESLSVDWEDLNSMQEGDKAKISLQRVQAILQYVTSGGEKILPLMEFFTKIMYFTQAEAEQMVVAARENKEYFTKELWETVQEGTGNPSKPASKTGALGKRNAQG